ncbi:FAD-dependent oxidoreductase [Adhaeribacter radiodurans]|uniref:FAD-dependent oxidoreductase n=1 Tax=Adhaeribacter radiodurans TaxID=2745197 RepID=A0A7L7L7X7_9BACT|nr:FAD-dependent oxidoreductase [Adhaeribacter radiodurans]QMU28645.1 FAD-dependent oxidoreductase [Adhaeribacter radiodurans]
MNRRNFVQLLTVGSGAAVSGLHVPFANQSRAQSYSSGKMAQELKADLVIAGGGLGGCAAALAALRNNLTVILTEETDWLGGQLTQQGVPPDEHQWIETHGATQLYRDFRKAIREYYRQNYPLTEQARSQPYFNPGNGAVSRIAHEPRVALAVLYNLFAPYLSSKKLTLLLEHKISKAEVTGNKVRSLQALNLKKEQEVGLTAPYFVDATELGELLPLTKTEFITGTESRQQTRELHAPEKADPHNQQAFTVCLAMDYVPGSNNTIDKPNNFNFWRNFTPKMNPAWSGMLLSLEYSDPKTLATKALGFHPEGVATGQALNLWNYRRIIHKSNFVPGTYAGDCSILNWPQNDYYLGNLEGVSENDFKKHVQQAKQLSLSLFYWLQTEAPRPDGGQGWPGLRLRGDILGTEDGLAKYPYIRESRRIQALFTILEEHVGAANRALITGKEKDNTAAEFYDSVGIGYYHIDLHPSSGGNNYIDFASLPFQIPLGALLPKRMENLLPASKNIGTTHITNGCYRLHPVEWSIGEAVGLLIAFAKQKKVLPREVREKTNLLVEFQKVIRSQGIETHWPT